MAKQEQPKAPRVAATIDDAEANFKHATFSTRLGDRVAFYGEGDPAQDPEVAIVSQVLPTGFRLHVFSARGITIRDTVRHIDDPWFDTAKAAKLVRRERGCWDTLDAMYLRLDAEAARRREMLAKQQAARESSQQSIIDDEPLAESHQMQVEQWAREGVEVPEMVKRLGGEYSAKRIQNHFENNPVSA